MATSLVLDTFGEFLSNEADVWLVKRETLESKVHDAATLAITVSGFWLLPCRLNTSVFWPPCCCCFSWDLVWAEFCVRDAVLHSILY